MPLTGPRPNPAPAPALTPTAFPEPPTNRQDDAPPYSFVDDAGADSSGAHQSTSTPSYPHQSSAESGTARLEPLNNRYQAGESEAQEIMRDYRNSRIDDGGDVGSLGAHKSSGYTYNNPYDDREMDREIDMDPEMQGQPRSISPSLGPWDSASQRSLPFHSNQSSPYPNSNALHTHQPSHIPLSQIDGQSGMGSYSKSHNAKANSYGGLSYIDENFEYFHTDQPRPASTTLQLSQDQARRDAVEMNLIGDQQRASGGMENPYYSFSSSKDGYGGYGESPYPYPTKNAGMQLRGPNTLYDVLLFPTGLDRLLALVGVKNGQYPVEQAIERKRRGIGGQRWPVAAWGLAIVMTALMVYEMVANYQAMGSPIATKPTFNPMIGPSSEVLINIGARFPPCMKLVEDLPPSFQLACLNDTSSTPTTSCSIEEICGHGGFHGENPDQSWRFVYPIFLHVGLVHLLLNMLAQITAAAQVEREMGTIPFLIVYMAGGIYGFVLGGNFSRTGIPSVGASGALFATNACVLVDLILHWKYEERPKLKAFLLAIEFLIGFGIGYIPNAVDGLAHLGGWAIGILLGIILYPSISETKRHKYILWGARVVAFVLAILAFVLTIKNFYTDDPNAACEWCRYLSCIPTNSNQHCKGTGIIVTETTSTRRSWDAL
ncbi:uncharacterized protein I303_106726 [Kwoniella dejecticola CBS 10117]|uniref:Rhomboid-type serine protease n=1 Tax=Kwoniella dejecticola CBS 10117 TaxID=1296121 RepID=A0A1A5ZTV1_9TREE|nr:rhomboid family membrane protein [Kwoniella dejecticola CBS 10117]OBR81247.1 rhomboid family membrane protein [Kwoniella dejecticola CBS 10117]